ncbi:nadh dehydrogenase [ubiquinone] 1 beta subcomplex subunit 7 [Quercus suber]|uniref:Nadh dehydrogenase [ubiquinone] 1 beta subcomplex subunit 7 n=1 Tax=Quercus suber TaxID=58331 RepID=A0AAW0KHK0_QUESU
MAMGLGGIWVAGCGLSVLWVLWLRSAVVAEDLGGDGLLRCVCVGRDEFIVFSDGERKRGHQFIDRGEPLVEWSPILYVSDNITVANINIGIHIGMFKRFPAWFVAWFPFNKCRRAKLYLPWKCKTKHHIYEQCEYELIMEQMIKMEVQIQH